MGGEEPVDLCETPSCNAEDDLGEAEDRRGWVWGPLLEPTEVGMVTGS